MAYKSKILTIADGGTGANTASGARTNLGLGTMAVQPADNVLITGGELDGVDIISPLLTTPSLRGAGTGTATFSYANTSNSQAVSLQTLTSDCNMVVTDHPIPRRIITGKGANVASANDLNLGADGNVFVITGNTTINSIYITNWSAGAQIILIFSGTPTVKNNTAGSMGTARIFLLGSTDFVIIAANAVLNLVYDGTQWQETSRKIA